jgi:hypothetical protein
MHKHVRARARAHTHTHTRAHALVTVAIIAATPCAAGIQPRQIGCVIVNSSLFNPTPSLAAMIMK